MRTACAGAAESSARHLQVEPRHLQHEDNRPHRRHRQRQVFGLAAAECRAWHSHRRPRHHRKAGPCARNLRLPQGGGNLWAGHPQRRCHPPQAARRGRLQRPIPPTEAQPSPAAVDRPPAALGADLRVLPGLRGGRRGCAAPLRDGAAPPLLGGRRCVGGPADAAAAADDAGRCGRGRRAGPHRRAAAEPRGQGCEGGPGGRQPRRAARDTRDGGAHTPRYTSHRDAAPPWPELASP